MASTSTPNAVYLLTSEYAAKTSVPVSAGISPEPRAHI